MKFLKGLIKFIEAFLLLLVPVVVFYWFLIVINLEVVKPFIAILGQLFDPFINQIKVFVHYEMPYNDGVIDFNPLIFTAFILVFAVFMSLIWNVLNTIELTVNKAKIKVKENEDRKQHELIRIKYLEELARNKVFYLVMKFRKKESSSAYLFNENQDSQSENRVDSLIKSIVDYSRNFNSKIVQNAEENEGLFSFIFYDLTEAIDYSFYAYNETIKAHKEFSSVGSRVSVSIGCHCAYSENTAPSDLSVAIKVLNLGGENEILVSELFKNKYEALKEETNLRFDSRGLYSIADSNIEIFQLKAESAI